MMEKERDIGQATGELLIFVVLSFFDFVGTHHPRIYILNKSWHLIYIYHELKWNQISFPRTCKNLAMNVNWHW